VTTRRSFLKLLAGTALAPFIPAIAAMPESETLSIEQAFLAAIGRGEPLYLGLGSADLEYKEYPRQTVRFRDDGVLGQPVSFPTATSSAVVSHLYLSDANGGNALPIKLRSDLFLSNGVTARVLDLDIGEHAPSENYA
jgi:hypothetical protein